MLSPQAEAVIDAALREDFPAGDITSESIIPASSTSRAVFLAKEAGVLAGLDVAARVFEKVDRRVVFIRHFRDGRRIRRGDRLASVRGASRSLLKAERTALNFLQRLSGTASLTARYVRAVRGTKARILDTRKTTPGLRELEKRAVRLGGGTNHRLSLSDMALIKDNHLAIVGSVERAVREARLKIGRRAKVEVEVISLAAAREALAAGADMIMLDNMPPRRMKAVVEWVAGRVPVEASGGVTLAKARSIALSGVDFISVGELTHSAPALDISLEFES